MSARMVGIGSALVVTAAAVLSVGMVEPGAGQSAVRQEVRLVAEGVSVSQEAIDAYSALKEQKKFRFMVLKIDDAETHVVVEKTSSSTDFDDFTEALQEAGDKVCRYGIYDLQYERDGKQQRKIFLIFWGASTATPKQRSLYSTSTDRVVKGLVGVTPYAALDPDELTYEALLAQARKNP